jgi:glycogen operon protein
VRSFLKGDRGTVARFAPRLHGSPDLYSHKEREPEQSINFITCHDGFTLNDLASYDHKHNEANGENNRDGSDNNISWNCGIEGPTDDPEIERLRNRQVKNFFAVTLLAVGAPMLLMGDEVRRTQKGNNNAYCQDNEISWFNWNLCNAHADIYRFVKHLIKVRLRRDIVVEDIGLTLNQFLQQAQIQWHGVKLNEPDWRDESHSIALTAWSLRGRFVIHFMINVYWEPLEFELLPVPEQFGDRWYRWIDTYRESPDDIYDLDKAALIEHPTYLVQARSIVSIIAVPPVKV